MAVFEKRTWVDATPEQLFHFHEQPDAFALLTPPWEPVRVVGRQGEGLAAGVIVELEMRFGPLRQRWVAEHVSCDPPHGFVDVARSGPFRSWRHEHRFEAAPQGGAFLVDHVTYELPFGSLGRLADRWVRRRLGRMFHFRHDATAQALANEKTPPGARPSGA